MSSNLCCVVVNYKIQDFEEIISTLFLDFVSKTGGRAIIRDIPQIVRFFRKILVSVFWSSSSSLSVRFLNLSFFSV